MPETIRRANERLRFRPWRGGFFVAFVIASFCVVPGTSARADGHVGTAAFAAIHDAIVFLRAREITALTLIVTLLSVAVLAGIALRYARIHSHRAEIDSRDELVALHAEVDRLKALLLSEPQVLVTWVAAEQPQILGDTSIVAPDGNPERILAFGTWLEPTAAHRMEQAVDTLRGEGRGFVLTLTSRRGRPIEAEG